jgi:ribosomal protein S19
VRRRATCSRRATTLNSEGTREGQQDLVAAGSTVIPDMVGHTIAVHDGPQARSPSTVTEVRWCGPQARRGFCTPTRTVSGYHSRPGEGQPGEAARPWSPSGATRPTDVRARAQAATPGFVGLQGPRGARPHPRPAGRTADEILQFTERGVATSSASAWRRPWPTPSTTTSSTADASTCRPATPTRARRSSAGAPGPGAAPPASASARATSRSSSAPCPPSMRPGRGRAVLAVPARSPAGRAAATPAGPAWPQPRRGAPSRGARPTSTRPTRSADEPRSTTRPRGVDRRRGRRGRRRGRRPSRGRDRSRGDAEAPPRPPKRADDEPPKEEK